MSHSTRLIVAGVLAPLLALASAPATPPVPRTLSLSGQIEITVDTYPAEGRFLLLWIAPGFGFRPAHPQTAARLAAAGLEVWLADVAEALFLPRGSRSMRELDGTYVADLIERAHSATGKAVVLVGGSYGAIPALRGARAWQARAPARPYLTGAVLFSPNAYARVPPLGADPQYLPIVRTTRLPIAILQGERNANRWQLPRLREALESGGSPVHVTLLPEVTGLFFQEPDEPWPAAAQREIDALPGRLARLLPLLERTATPPGPAPPAPAPPPTDNGLNAELEPFEAALRPRPIRLPTADGASYALTDYRGRVTVVNFWASWCPPCVEEIPSLNRLREAMTGRAFELVSINYAEPPATVRAFLDRVDVDFPVLLDRDGRTAASWNVVAFPSTFVIGPHGRIRYGVNAAIRWDAPAVVTRLRALADAAE